MWGDEEVLLKAVLCVTQHQHMNINIAGYK